MMPAARLRRELRRMPRMRTSPKRSSPKLASRFGWWHHACCGGDIPLSLQRYSPAVVLIEERSPDESSSTDRKSIWRLVPDHVYHLDPRAFRFLCART